jgi:nucleoside-diphosphate kinase
MSQKTLILLKPDAVERQLVGRILSRYESKGLQVVALKLLRATRKQAAELYAIHKGRPFYKGLVDYIGNSPLIAAVLQGEEAIKLARALNGATNPKEALPGTIRGDLAVSQRYNLVHASDSAKTAKKEIAIFFDRKEIVKYAHLPAKWL